MAALEGAMVGLAELIEVSRSSAGSIYLISARAMTTLNGNSTFPQNNSTTSSTAPGKRKRSESVDELSPIITTRAAKQFSGFSQKLQNALPILRK